MKESRAIAPVRFVGAEVMRNRVEEVLGTVARRAFEIFEIKGYRAGHDVDDWLQAETELLQPVNVELSETDGIFMLRAEVPGFSRKDIQLSVEPRRVTITATRDVTANGHKRKVLPSEGCLNQALRAIDLPTEIDTTGKTITAAFGDGVLTITLPKHP